MPRVKQFDREEVLEKAMELFWQKGFHATSIRDLVEYCGINRASMYDTFGGKDEIFLQALNRYHRESHHHLHQLGANLEQKPVQQFLSDFLFKKIQIIRKDPDSKGCFMVNSTTELASQSESIHKVVHSSMCQMRSFFKDVIELAQRNGEISAQRTSSSLALHLFTFISGLEVVGKIEKEDLEKLIQSELDLIFQ